MNNLVSRVKATGLLQGDFTLRSGRKAKYYLDVKKSFGDPRLLNDLADSLYELMRELKPTCVVAYGFGGQPIADVMASRHVELKLTRIRDSLKNYGTGRQIEGYEPNSFDRVIIPDDVFTTGSSLKDATKIIQPTGAQIVSYGVIVNREEGDPSSLSAPLVWLMTAREVMKS